MKKHLEISQEIENELRKGKYYCEGYLIVSRRDEFLTQKLEEILSFLEEKEGKPQEKNPKGGSVLDHYSFNYHVLKDGYEWFQKGDYEPARECGARLLTEEYRPDKLKGGKESIELFRLGGRILGKLTDLISEYDGQIFAFRRYLYPEEWKTGN